MKEYPKAEDLFKEGSKRYPDDARFHIETRQSIPRNHTTSILTKSELRNAPRHSIRTTTTRHDELATIDMSEGDVQSARCALGIRAGVHSSATSCTTITLSFWIARSFDAPSAFHPVGTLRYDEWKTTEARLFETGKFLEPSGWRLNPHQFPIHIQRSLAHYAKKTNTLGRLRIQPYKRPSAGDRLLGPVECSGNTGLNFNGNYRWGYESAAR
jgi:hypothetical protein